MKGPRWIDRRTLLLLHAESLAEHGGLTGIRDDALLDSALARPRHRLTYRPNTGLPALAASYAFGIAKNHPFADGNKRAAFLSIGLFLGLNGYRLVADKAEAALTMQALSSGQIPEGQLAVWIRRHMKRWK